MIEKRVSLPRRFALEIPGESNAARMRRLRDELGPDTDSELVPAISIRDARWMLRQIERMYYTLPAYSAEWGPEIAGKA